MRSTTRCFALFAVAAVFGALLSVTPANAGSTGSLTGTIKDDKGAPVAGAHVSAAAATGSYKTVTDAKGFFSIVNISPDTYTVTVTAPGFSPAVHGHIDFGQRFSRMPPMSYFRALCCVPVRSETSNAM